MKKEPGQHCAPCDCTPQSLGFVGCFLQFPLNDQGARADNNGRIPGGVLDDQHIVAVILCHPLVTLGKSLATDLPNSSEDTKTVEEAGIVVGLAKGPGGVARGQGGGDGRADEFRREEAFLGGSHGGRRPRAERNECTKLEGDGWQAGANRFHETSRRKRGAKIAGSTELHNRGRYSLTKD